MTLFRTITGGRVRSFRSRLIVFAAVTSAIAAIVVSIALVTTKQLRIRSLVSDQLHSQAAMAAHTVGPPLALNMREEAREALRPLEVVDHLVAVKIFDAQGNAVLTHELQSTQRRPPLVQPMAPGLYRHAGWLVLHSPVDLGDVRIGALALIYDPRWISGIVWMSIAKAAIITAAATAVAVLLALRLQGALARPIREIISTSRVVSETGDYSANARKFDEDELGDLTDAFNDMLARIDHQSHELQHANERFRVSVESAPNGMIMIDQLGQIVLVNTTAEQMFGYPREELLDQPVEMLIPERFREDHLSAQRAFFTEPIARSMGAGRDLYGLRKDGSEFPVEIGLNPIATSQGLRVLSTIIDITERKAAEAEREQLLRSERAARSEAERASRMKDEFLATLSHELRTPLTAILGWAQMLLRREIDDDMINEGLATIERNAKVQTQIIEDLLDMSRIISGKIRLDVQLVELPEIIEAAIATVQPAADAKGVRLQKILDPRVPVVRGDASRLQQIVWNLLSNAVKFTPKGGRVQVALERVNSHIEINVSDTGEGMEEQFIPHLFERFRQADSSFTRPHAGLGIGLALVKHLTELHGGSVSATSPGKGQGSTFTMKLPMAVTHAARDDGERVHPTRSFGSISPLVEPEALRGVRVLIVEDERDARALIERILENALAQVDSAESGFEALEKLERFKPHVIVSDIGMPEMDGYQFIRQVREMSPDEGGRTPAVALTAFARSEDRTRALIAGYQMHVAKPVEPSELLATVAALASLNPHNGVREQLPGQR